MGVHPYDTLQILLLCKMERPLRHFFRWTSLAIGLIAVWAMAGDAFSQSTDSSPLPRALANTEEYFPDGIGSVWQYVGSTHTEKIEHISRVTFKNEVTTIGTSNMNGVTVKIFRETNQGNKGPTDGYFRRDDTGIVYHGSRPTTPFEQQLVPYRILNFPLVLGTTFHQLNKTNVDMQADLDGDGQPERGNVVAEARVVGYEPLTVGAGAFPEALRIDAVMTLSVTMSKNRHLAVSKDRISSWFVRGVGLVKYEEIIEAPPVLETRGAVTYLSEELESYTIKGMVNASYGPPVAQSH
jgi:hypothetical protein